MLYKLVRFLKKNHIQVNYLKNNKTATIHEIIAIQTKLRSQLKESSRVLF